MPPKLDSTLFTWQTWRNGSSRTLGLLLSCQDAQVPWGQARLKEAITGWCEGTSLPCRPKAGQVGVMCWWEGEEFWFHLWATEFLGIYPGA